MKITYTKHNYQNNTKLGLGHECRGIGPELHVARFWTWISIAWAPWSISPMTPDSMLFIRKMSAVVLATLGSRVVALVLDVNYKPHLSNPQPELVFYSLNEPIRLFLLVNSILEHTYWVEAGHMLWSMRVICT